jgi:hypothetical protein
MSQGKTTFEFADRNTGQLHFRYVAAEARRQDA